MNKTQVLNKLDRTLSDFLRAYAVKRLNHLTAEDKIDRLREISFSNKPEYKKMDDRLVALEEWFNHNMADISREDLNVETIQQLIDSTRQIEILSRGNVDDSRENEILFDRKRALNVANLANRFLNQVTREKETSPSLKAVKLTRPSEERQLPASGDISGETIKEKFANSLKYQQDVIETYKDDKYHLFSIVDNLLARLESTKDVKASHMAASVLYFMKLNGYKTAPYVEKLRKLNWNRND